MKQPGKHELALRMADLARAFSTPRNIEDVLENVTATAKELIPGVDAAGILLIGKGGSFESIAADVDVPHQLDVLQMQFDEGPCRQAALADVVVRTDDFREETRWPQYSPACQPARRTVGIGIVQPGSDRPSQRHHHGTVQSRRRTGF